MTSTEKEKVDWSDDTGARITPEHLERARFLLGYDEASSLRQQVTEANEDNIRAFALSYGSDNPLHCDGDYAKRTRWGGVVAPGMMAMTIGAPMRIDPRPEDIARAKKGIFKGIHQLHSSTAWEWYQHIRPGDRLYRFTGEESVEVKESKFAGNSVVRVTRTGHFNQKGDLVAVMRGTFILSERSTAAKRGKYKEIEPAFYTDEDFARIDEIYANEKVRGDEPRYWEDVEIGETMGTMAKGPITVTDIIYFHTTGFAMLPFGPTTSRLAYKRRQVMPAAFVKDSHGIPDIVMRMHWDDDWAKAIGSPMAYDYAFQRECWLEHYLTDWCGDEGIVISINDRMKKFNYLGDFQTITGEIIDKKRDGDLTTVDAKVTFTSQRDEITVEAQATIALPSRTHGEAKFPPPPGDLQNKAQALLARHYELGGN